MDSSKLRLNRYSKAYRSRLLSGGQKLERFLRGDGSTLNKLLNSRPPVVDEILESFVMAMHGEKNNGVNMRQAKHAVLLLQILRPELKHQLKKSWETLKAWEESLPSGMRSPLPVTLLVAMICQARILAFEADDDSSKAKKWLRVSMLLGLGFFGLLRPGEMLALKRKHICFPNSITFALPAVTVTIEKPKNFRQLGTSQFVTIKQPDTCNWIVCCCHDMKATDPLWNFSQSEFRRCFKTLLSTLCCDECKFSPASLRAGGATFLFDQCSDIGRLRLMGRWASMQSLEHYIQVGKSQQLLQDLNQKCMLKIKTILRDGGFLLGLPKFLSRHLDKSSLIHSRAFDCHGKVLSISCRDWASLDQENAESDSDRREPQRSFLR